MKRIIILLTTVSIITLSCTTENLQASLEQAVRNKNVQQVETLLNKGADAFSPRGTQPSIFKEAIFRSIEELSKDVKDSITSPTYLALYRKWRSKYPLVDTKLTIEAGMEFRGFDESGAQLIALITSTYNGKKVNVSFTRYETEFNNIKVDNNGFAIGIIPNGNYKIKGRLIDDTIEVESVLYIGEAADSNNLLEIAIKSFFPSTAKIYADYGVEYYSIKSKTTKP